MKRTALKKEFRREVKKSLNRFLSIFFIVAMGVAFYSGIQASAPDMRITGDNYFDLTNLMDIRVIGTLGLTEDDLDAIGSIEGVESVTGCYMEDVLSGVDDAQKVLHIESVPEKINLLTPEEGELPDKAGECFLDASYATQMGYEVGDTLEIMVSSEEDTLLRRRSFTISGYGHSPAYISFKRGSTTLGTGSISGFAYILEDDFDSEVYTVAYVKVEGANEAAAFTDEYDGLIEEVYDRIEGIADVRCEIRYDEVMAEAQETLDEAKQEVEDGKQELEDAKQELKDGKAEAESELAEAESELTEGEQELVDGKQELEDAKQEIEDGEAELADGEAEIEENAETLADARSQIEEARGTLSDGEAEYLAGLREYQSSSAEAKKGLVAAQKQIDDGKRQLEAGWQEYEENLALIESGEAQIAEAEKQLQEGQVAYDAAYDSTVAQLEAGQASYEAGKADLEAGRQAYEAGVSELAAKRQEYETGRAQLDGAWGQYNSGMQQLTAGQAAYDEAAGQVAALQSAYDSTVSDVSAKQSAYESAAASNMSLHSAYTAAVNEISSLESSCAAAPEEIAQLRSQQSQAEQNQQMYLSQVNTKTAEKSAKETEKAEKDAQYQELQTTIQNKETNGEDASAEKEQAAALKAVSDQLSSEIVALNAEISGLNSQAAAAGQTAAEAKQEADAKEQALAADQQRLESLKAGLPQQKAELDAEDQKLAQQKTELETAQTALVQQKTALDAANTELGTQKAVLDQTAATLAETKAYLDTQEQTMAAGKAALEQGQAALDDSKQEIEAGEAQLEAAKQQIDAGYAQLEAAAQELTAGKQQLEQKKAELATGKSELEKGKATLEASEKQLEDAQKQVDDGYAQLASAKSQLDAAREELDLGWAKLNTSLKQLNEGEQQLEDARTQLTDARTELADARQQIADAEKEIAENEQKIKDGWEEYEEGKLEAEQEIADAEEKIKDAEQELLDAEEEIADAEEELAEIKVPSWYVDDRSVLPENSGFGENADRLTNIGKVFPVLFFLVAALISLTTMTRMVEEERTQIGTMKALGYSKISIASKYMKYAFYATIGGSVFGVLFGEKVFPWVIVTAYCIMYPYIPEILLPYNLEYGVIATAAALICTLGATLSACYREFQSVPAQLMRPPTPKDGKRVFLEYIPFIWRRLSFTWKSTIRNLVRYKKRFLMTVIGIGGCMGLLLVGYGLRDSIGDVGILQFDELQYYEAMVIFDTDASEEKLEKAYAQVKEDQRILLYDHYYMQREELQTEGSKEWSVYLYVPQNPETINDYFCFRDRETHEVYELTDEGAIITEKIARQFDIKPGDTILLKQEDGDDVEILISAVCENYLAHYLYLTPALYEQVYGETPDFNSILLRCEGGDAVVEEIGKDLLEQDAVLNITYTKDSAEQMHNMLSTLDIVIVVLILAAGMLAFVVLYNLNNININERKRELATIKVLGFYDGEVGAYVYRENVLLTIIGAVLGVFIGMVLHAFIITTVEVDDCMFGRNIRLMSYVYGTLFTFAFSIIVNFVMYFKLKKIDMVESLKSIE